jgi:hypothetical protein
MYVVYFSKLAFQKINANGQADGPEDIVLRGDPVPDYVMPYQISALSTAGMIVEVGDGDPRIRPVEAEPLPPVSAETPPGPSGPALLDLGAETVVVVTNPEVPPTPATPTDPVKPKASDSRNDWEQYGVRLGMDQLALEALPNKAAVIEAVNKAESGS